MTRTKRLEQMKKVSKARRQKLQKDPELREAENLRRRQKYAADAQKRLLKKKNMGKREKRKVQKKWRESKRKSRENCKIIEKQGGANPGPSNGESHQVISGKVRRRRNMARCYYKIRTMTSEISNLKRKVLRYKVRLSRSKAGASNNLMTKSPRSTLNKKLRNPKKVSPLVKRQLLFGAALAADVQEGLSKVSSPKLRRKFRMQFSFKFLTKYRFMSLAKPFFKVKSYQDPRKRIGCRKMVYSAVAQKVKKFYEQDDVSTQSPGKKEYITRNKIQKQKRYLCHSLQYLHKKFCEDNEFVISYSSFCRLRPFWVISRHISGRDTCLCRKCENMTLVHAALKRMNLFSSDLPTTIKDLCCTSPSEQCYFRKCPACVNKIINFDIDGAVLGEDDVMYDFWEKISEKGEDGKTYQRIVKMRKHSTISSVCDLFFQLQPDYMAHIGRIRHQYRALKDLKNTAKEDPSTVVIHCDFSENYGCKYGREIQSCHFGANWKQITLHTGILYNGAKTLAFSSVSRCLYHDAIAIWCHLKPILQEYAQSTTKLHFISDSPSSQYRNKGMFKIIFEKIIPLFPNLLEFTWNYLESGHGKGAADGVGGVLKRTCDRLVAQNEDIATFEQFFSCVQINIPNVHLVAAIDRDTELQDINLTNSMAVKGKTSISKVIQIAAIFYSLSSPFL